MKTLRYSLCLLLTGGALAACALADQLSTAQEDQVATSVAATLEALDQSQEPPAPNNTTIPSATAISKDKKTLQKIVFTDNQDVWIIEIGSSPRQLTFEGDVEEVRISSDGKLIAFTRRTSTEENSDLYSILPDGSGEKLVLSRQDVNQLYPSPAGTEGFDIGSYSFRPGTHELFFNTLEVFEGLGYRKTNDLFKVDLDSGELAGILPASAGGEFVFSPNGKKIAIVRPDSISIVNGDGSDYLPELLTYPPVITYSEFQYYPQPVWSQDSSMIGVALPSDDPLAEEVYGEVWYIPANGAPPEIQAKISGDFYFVQVFSNSILSPDLDRVAFTRPTGVQNQRDLFIANVDGSEEMLFDTGSINWEGWAPDSMHFVYSASEPTALIVALDGGRPMFTLSGTDLQWISDQSYLLLSGESGDWSLYLGMIDGTSEILTRPGGDFIDYDFSD